MARIDVPAQNIVQSICQLSAIQKFEKAGPIRLDNSESTFTMPYNPVREGKRTKKGNYRIIARNRKDIHNNMPILNGLDIEKYKGYV